MSIRFFSFIIVIIHAIFLFHANAFTYQSIVKSSRFHQSIKSSLRDYNQRSNMFTMQYEAPKFSVGIVGASGAVGEEILSVMETRNFPASEVHLFSSERSAGVIKDSPVYGKLKMHSFSLEEAKKCDVILLAVSGDFALQWAEKLTSLGCLVIDNSSAFRYKPDVPLIIPEVNIKAAKGSKLIANPNCTTAIALMALWPIHLKYKIKKAIFSTYQAASGAGSDGMRELQEGMKAVCEGRKATNAVFAHPLPYNLIPHIDVFQENKYTKEEMKVAWETRKIMDAPDMKISVTAVRIPTLRAHSEAITIETELPIDPNDVRELLRESPGIDVVDDPSTKKYPMPLTATGKYNVEVGRIRQSLVFEKYGIDLFVCGDQLLRGAALNAVLIAEEMLVKGEKLEDLRVGDLL